LGLWAHVQLEKGGALPGAPPRSQEPPDQTSLWMTYPGLATETHWTMISLGLPGPQALHSLIREFETPQGHLPL